MKFLHQPDENHPRYLIWWEKGYVMGINEWWQIYQQLSRRWHLNWLNATVFKLDFEFSMMYGTRLEATLVILGLGLYIQIELTPPSLEQVAEVDRWLAEIEGEEE